jgi:hypothetical protein
MPLKPSLSGANLTRSATLALHADRLKLGRCARQASGKHRKCTCGLVDAIILAAFSGRGAGEMTR